ncbi:MAG TPA: cupin domain-containing protein [Steroidobacteraceae bacterium]|jgi:quercetin dioxygenase-like cupin family protein
MTNAVNAVLYNWDEVRLDNVRGSITRRFISTERMTVGQIVLEKGDDVPRHSHENEQLTYVITGSLKFWFGAADEQELVVNAGSLVVIPAGLPHRALALESTFELDLFNPPRADWQDGTDAYFRR